MMAEMVVASIACRFTPGAQWQRHEEESDLMLQGRWLCSSSRLRELQQINIYKSLFVLFSLSVFLSRVFLGGWSANERKPHKAVNEARGRKKSPRACATCLSSCKRILDNNFEYYFVSSGGARALGGGGASGQTREKKGKEKQSPLFPPLLLSVLPSSPVQRGQSLSSAD
mmetsp:Transcript_18832/g.38275  ORF Transcript_18832/g.38275 Transcript_18832/m.38275 type:complete len:170 (-) Transcript_18832:93-602(-)